MTTARNNASQTDKSKASDEGTDLNAAEEEAKQIIADRDEKKRQEDMAELAEHRKEKAEREKQAAALKEKLKKAKAIPGAAMSVAVGVESSEPGDDASSQVNQGVTGTRGKGWKYQRVVFHPKRNSSDTETVKLKLNGVGLIFHREVEVVVPVPYLRESADHAMQDQFMRDPEKGHKRRAPVKKYDYTILGDSDEEEYAARLTTGNANAKKYRMTMQARG